jgi:hypothetical protein
MRGVSQPINGRANRSSSSSVREKESLSPCVTLIMVAYFASPDAARNTPRLGASSPAVLAALDWGNAMYSEVAPGLVPLHTRLR